MTKVAHARSSVARLSLIPLVGSLLCLLAATLLAIRSPPSKSSSEALSSRLVTTDALGNTRVQYTFGTTLNNWCFERTRNGTNGRYVGGRGREDTSQFPSILRTIQLHAGAQVLVRLAVLGGLSVRIFCSYFWVARITSLQSISTNPLAIFIISLCPMLQLFESAFAFLLATLHADQDQRILELLPVSAVLLFVFSIAHSVIYTSVNWMVEKTSTFSSFTFRLRLISTAILFISAPTVVQSLLDYLEHRPCHPFVPYRVALQEWASAAAIIVFHLSTVFDLPELDLVISAEQMDVLPPVTDEYEAVEWREQWIEVALSTDVEHPQLSQSKRTHRLTLKTWDL